MPRPHKGKPVCECCGAPTMENRFSLTPAMASALFMFGESGVHEVLLRTVGLTQYQWNNFHRLKYWGMVEPGETKGGWKMTAMGWRWLGGVARVRKHVWIYRDDVLEFAGPRVGIQEI